MAKRTLMWALVSALFCLTAHSAGGQTPPLAAPTASTAAAEAVQRLRQRDPSEVMLHSREGLEYRILLSVPRGPAPAGGFPVFYVLDGDAWFSTAVEIVRMREWSRLTPSIVVGVGYPSHAFFDGPRRNYDFTPPGSAEADLAPEEQGGADRFLAFLTDVLRPWVSQHYPIDAERQVLFGHSYGGLFVLHTLFTAPRSFNVYLAASPAIRFSNRILLREEPLFEANPARTTVRTLITWGELESRPNPQQIEDYRRYFTANPSATGGLGVEEALRQTFPPIGAFNKARELRQLARRLSRSGAHVSVVEFAGEEHTSSAVSALNRGVPFALRPAN